MGESNIEKMKAEKDVEGLIIALTDKSHEVRAAAIDALGKLSDARAVEPLIMHAYDEYSCYYAQQSAIYERIMKSLVKLKALSLEPLLQALGDKREVLRIVAIEALGDIGDIRVVEPLIQTLEDKRIQVRIAAAKALAKLGDARVVEPLIQALGDKNNKVRLAVMKALGNTRDARAVSPLARFMEDKNKVVQLTVLEALGKIGKPAISHLLRALKGYIWGRSVAAKALGEIGDDRAVEHLILALKDIKWVRGSVAEALGKIGNARAVEPLIQALKTKREGVRESVVQALGMIGDARAIEPLIQALEGYSEYESHFIGHLPQTAIEALIRIGEPAIEPLAMTLKDKNASLELREGARVALRKIKAKKRKKALKTTPLFPQDGSI